MGLQEIQKRNDEIEELPKRHEELQKKAEGIEEWLGKLIEGFKSNEDIEALRRKNEDQRSKIVDLQAKLTQHETMYKEVQGQIHLYEAQTANLQRRIESLDSPFLHRFRFDQITETEIRDRFDGLCLHVSSWVTKHIPWEDVSEPMFLDNSDPYLASFFTDDNKAGMNIIDSLIHQCLQKEFLGGHVYLVGLPDDHSDFLRLVQTFMARPRRYPERTRESKTVHEWRSETLKALAYHPQTIKMRITNALSAAERIFAFVKQFYPIIINRQQSFRELYEDVVMPSIALAVDMQTSWSPYTFIPAMDNSKDLYHFEKTKMNIITSVAAIDIKSSIPLEWRTEVIVCDSEGFVGIPRMLVEQALYVNRHSNHDEDLLLSLRRGTYLIELFHQLEVPRQDNDQQTLEPKQDNDQETLLAVGYNVGNSVDGQGSANL